MNLSSLVQINEGLVFAVIVAAWVVYRVVRNLIVRHVNLSREVLLNLAFVYGCFVFKVTFFPMIIVLYAFDPDAANLVPLVKTLQMVQHASLLGVVRNLVGNLVLLAPLGWFLPVFFPKLRKAWKALGAGFLVSLSIELAQLLLKVRTFDVDDLLFNTLGVLVGFCLFLLFNRLPSLSRLFARVSGQLRKGQQQAFLAYGLVALLAFLSIYSYQIVQQTQSITAITHALPADQQALLGTPKFGDFLYVFSQSEQGEKSLALYRRVFFNRYTPFEWGDIRLEENTYRLSGMSTGHWMNFFVIARSQKRVGDLVSEGLKFPVVQVGDYYFSYARFPLKQMGQYPSFRFLDPQGTDLPLSK